MNRKTLLLLALLLIILAAGIYLSNPFSTLSPADRSIPLDHPEEVTSVVLEEQGKRLVLEKDTGGHWTVNGRFPASRRAVYDLLGWLQRIDIQAPLSGDPGTLGTEGTAPVIRLEIFRKNRKIRDLEVLYGNFGDARFLVRRTRRDSWFLAGSYGKEIPAAVLSGTGAAAWREKILFRLDPTAIRSVELRYADNADASFRLEYAEGEGFTLFNHLAEPAGVPDRDKATRYFAYFMQIPLEEYLDPGKTQLTDSAAGDTPLFMLMVETGEAVEEYYFYPLKRSGEEGESTTDPYRLVGLRKGTDEHFRIRYLDIDPVLKDLNYFME